LADAFVRTRSRPRSRGETSSARTNGARRSATSSARACATGCIAPKGNRRQASAQRSRLVPRRIRSRRIRGRTPAEAPRGRRRARARSGGVWGRPRPARVGPCRGTSHRSGRRIRSTTDGAKRWNRPRRSESGRRRPARSRRARFQVARASGQCRARWGWPGQRVRKSCVDQGPRLERRARVVIERGTAGTVTAVGKGHSARRGMGCRGQRRHDSRREMPPGEDWAFRGIPGRRGASVRKQR
jgi:hypothetical protein